MKRCFWVGALLTLACGGNGEQALFDGDPREPDRGAQVAAGSPGSAGDGSVGQSESGAPGEPSAAGTSQGGAGGAVTAGGAGTAPAGQAGVGTGGVVPTAGTGGQSEGGGGQSVGGSAGKGGDPQAGSGGSGPLECADEMLDCTNAAGCEAWMGDHDTCGSCENKCGITQVCKRYGEAGNWWFGCTS
jgi:hypothetical protein